MALEFLENSLHSLCVSIHVDDVRKRKFKRYMDLSRSINSLKFNKGVILKNLEEGAPDYEAFVKCLNKKKSFDSTNESVGKENTPCPGDPCGSVAQVVDPCGSSRPADPCFVDPCKSPCPSDGNENPEPDVCEMLDLIGDTTPIILMDLLEHQPDMLARAMANDDECEVINVESSECLPDDEACLVNEQSIKDAAKSEVEDALCKIRTAQLVLSKHFKIIEDMETAADPEQKSCQATL